MKIIVCKGCKRVMEAINADTKKPACVICIGLSNDTGIPIEIEVPEKLKCGCGSTVEWDKEKNKYILTFLSEKGGWNCTYNGNRELDIKQVPFINTEENKFYCGCSGWN